MASLNFDVPEVSSPVHERSEAGPQDTFTRTVRGSTKVGSNPPPTKKGLFGNLDYVKGSSEIKRFSVGKDDRMTSEQAWAQTQRILAMFDLSAAEEGEIMTFMEAMFYCHAINGGSVLQPGRAVISCLGNEFQYARVVDLLGNDLRRYFRAYADEVRKTLLRILNSDPRDVETWEMRSVIIEVSYDRGIGRYPDLIHDTADACSWINAAERAAVANSKKLVLSTGINTADSMVASGRALGPEGYDSTAGAATGVNAIALGRRS